MRRAMWAATCSVLVVAGLLVGAGPAGAATTATADFRFQNTRASTSQPSPTLVDLIGCQPGCDGTNDPNTFLGTLVDGHGQDVLFVPQDNGVAIDRVSRVIGSDNYTIVLLVSLVSDSGWRRLVDVKDGTSDSGLYVDPNDHLDFYDHAAGSTMVNTDEWDQIVLTRNGRTDRVTGYLNGVEEFSFVDSTDEAVIDANDVLRFLQDNTTGCTCGEDSPAKLARIRLFRGPLDAAAVAGLDRVAPDAAVTVDPTVAAPGDSLTLRGADYGPKERVSISFVDASGTRTALGTWTTDGFGSFEQSVAVPSGASPGAARITSKGARSGFSVKVRVTVSS